MSQVNLKQGQAVWNALHSNDNRVFHVNPTANDHIVYFAPTEQVWSRARIHIPTSGGHTVPQLNDISWRFFSDRDYPRDDPSITYSGTWTNTTWQGEGIRADVLGAYAEWTTTPTKSPVAFFSSATNGGLSRIYIDGDATAANCLFTAQEVIDQGWYTTAILTSGGGALSPTDRVYYHGRWEAGSTGDALTGVLLAIGLDNAAHTVRVEATGYVSEDVGAGDRTYFYGWGIIEDYGTAAEWVHLEGYKALAGEQGSPRSALEYAIQYKPTAPDTNHWAGNVHLNESLTSISAVADATSATITRETSITHPDGSGDYADITTVYTFTQGGMRIDTTTDWQQSALVLTAYLAMQPLFSFDGLRRINMDSCRTSNYASTVDISANDDTDYDMGVADIMWSWDSSRQIVAGMKIYPISELSTNEIFMQDRSGASGAFDKWYASKILSSETAVSASDTWVATAVHRFKLDSAGSANTALMAGVDSGSSPGLVEPFASPIGTPMPRSLSPNPILNPNLEDRTGSNFDNWTEVPSGTSTITADTADVPPGYTVCARIDVDGSNSNVYLVPTGTLDLTNGSGIITFMCKCEDSNGLKLSVRADDGAGGSLQYLSSNGESWQDATALWVPANQPTSWGRIYHKLPALNAGRVRLLVGSIGRNTGANETHRFTGLEIRRL